MSGELQPNKKMVNIRELVIRNYELFKENAAEKNISLNLNIPPNLFVLVDPDHLDIVLRNTIQNAIKFTYPDGTVHAETLLSKDSIAIIIKDNGQGMSKEVLNNLFTYNKQPGVYGTKGERGAGIGLILTKEFVERNKGQILVTSTEGKGTEVALQFPLI